MARKFGGGTILLAIKNKRELSSAPEESAYREAIVDIIDAQIDGADGVDDDVAGVIRSAIEENPSALIGIAEILFAQWGGRRRRLMERAIGDGTILDAILKWISEGGLDLILKFILGLLTGIGGIGFFRSR